MNFIKEGNGIAGEGEGEREGEMRERENFAPSFFLLSLTSVTSVA
jgi:hypothetical protein